MIKSFSFVVTTNTIVYISGISACMSVCMYKAHNVYICTVDSTMSVCTVCINTRVHTVHNAMSVCMYKAHNVYVQYIIPCQCVCIKHTMCMYST